MWPKIPRRALGVAYPLIAMGEGGLPDSGSSSSMA